MRTAFFDSLLELAAHDDRIELVVGDLGFGVVEPFAQRFPTRFTNVGVAEQNMTGVATGLALTGSVVFTYSIANFPTLRCLEQIRSDVAYHRANVKIVAVGGGLAYGALGISHHASEDLAIMRAMPGVAVAAPADPVETSVLTRVIAAMEGPAYLRLGKAGEPVLHARAPSLAPGTTVTLIEGDDVAIFSTGAILATALAVHELLRHKGISASVTSTPWLDPLDTETIRQAGLRHDLVVTLEEHSVVGGLGGAVAEVLAEDGSAAPLLRIGLPAGFTSIVGTQAYLLERYGLDPGTVADRIVERLERRSGDGAPDRASALEAL